MTEFMRPQVTVETVDDRVARYIVEPLERGFGYTLGNCMRRVLLSSLQGAAATSARDVTAEKNRTGLSTRYALAFGADRTKRHIVPEAGG